MDARPQRRVHRPCRYILPAIIVILIQPFFANIVVERHFPPFLREAKPRQPCER